MRLAVGVRMERAMFPSVSVGVVCAVFVARYLLTVPSHANTKVSSACLSAGCECGWVILEE